MNIFVFCAEIGKVLTICFLLPLVTTYFISDVNHVYDRCYIIPFLAATQTKYLEQIMKFLWQYFIVFIRSNGSLYVFYCNLSPKSDIKIYQKDLWLTRHYYLKQALLTESCRAYNFGVQASLYSTLPVFIICYTWQCKNSEF